MTDDQSPYADLKESKDQAVTAAKSAYQTVKKINDFARHSTSKILGPLATISLSVVTTVYGFVTGQSKPRKPPEEPISPSIGVEDV